MGLDVVRIGDRIEVTVVDEQDLKDLVAAIDEMSGFMGTEGLTKCLILVDEAFASVDTLDRHKLGIHAAKVMPRNVRIAGAGPPEVITHMFEATAKTRGLTTKVFHDADEARAWLDA